MSDLNSEDRNETDAGQTAELTDPVLSSALELQAMLIIYDRLVVWLEETCDERLDILAESLSSSRQRCRALLAQRGDDATCQAMVREMREGLRHVPQTLRALLPGIGPRLGESLEYRLGIQFPRF